MKLPGQIAASAAADDVLTGALLVTAVEIYVDANTMDRLFVLHSEEHKPVIVRIPALELHGYLERLSQVIAKSMH